MGIDLGRHLTNRGFGLRIGQDSLRKHEVMDQSVNDLEVKIERAPDECPSALLAHGRGPMVHASCPLAVAHAAEADAR
jgi:hypothetical protein